MSNAATAQQRQKVQNQTTSMIEEFQKAYGQALLDARVSEQLTDEPGWLSFYAGQRDEQKKERIRLSKEIDNIGEFVAAEVNEETASMLQEAKKQVTALVERVSAFDTFTVGPIKEPVDRCRDIVQKYRSLAARTAADSPLHAHGLLEAVNQAIKASEEVVWDAARGQVVIHPEHRQQ